MSEGVFHPDWIFHHRATANSANLGRVLIERVTARGEFNFETGTQDGAEAKPIYRGPARIQKVGFSTTRDFVEDTAKFQRMRIVVGFEDNEFFPLAFDVHVNDRITVLENKSDPEKVGEVYYVHGDESSTNAWNRVLNAQNNMKQA